MPSRNVIKLDIGQSYYHVYARGTNKQLIFNEAADYAFFVHLFERYLSSRPAKRSFGSVYPHYYGRLQLLTYCLMPNHFHLLLYQEEQGAMSAFMHSLMTSYSRYFNLKHGRTGSLFESRYKAARIEDQSYLEHISRYIHLNPRRWRRYAYSSLQFYTKDAPPEWLYPTKITELFTSTQEYLTFLQEYEGHRQMLDSVKHMLANQN